MQALKTFLFDLMVASKLFLKMLLFSQKMVSISSLKNLQKSKKCCFWTLRNFFFTSVLLQNHFVKCFLWPTFDLKSFLKTLLRFLTKLFPSCHSRIYVKVKNNIFKPSELSFLTSRQLQNYFLKLVLWPLLELTSFELKTFYLTFAESSFS